MTAPLTAEDRLTLQPLLFLSFQSGAFDSNSQRVPIAGSSRSAAFNLFAEYGFSDRIAAGTQLALLHNDRELAGKSASSTGLGDTLLFARYALPLPPVARLPDLSLFVQAKVPSGQADALDPARLGTDALGTGAWELTAGLDLTEYLWPVVLHLDLFFAAALETSLDGVPTRPGSAFLWAASGELPLPLPFWPYRWGLMVELSGRIQGDTLVDGEVMPGTQVREITLGAGVEFLFSDELQLLVGYQRTLWGTNLPAVDVLGVTLVPTL